MTGEVPRLPVATSKGFGMSNDGPETTEAQTAGHLISVDDPAGLMLQMALYGELWFVRDEDGISHCLDQGKVRIYGRAAPNTPGGRPRAVKPSNPADDVA